MSAIITATLPLLIGVATYYSADYYTGRPLYCNYQDSSLVYTETLEPWIALDVTLYQSGQVECGDQFLLTFTDGYTLTVSAWDAGLFNGHWVPPWPELPIVIDLPQHLKPFAGIAGLVTARKLPPPLAVETARFWKGKEEWR
jgi:hypothetical protein